MTFEILTKEQVKLYPKTKSSKADKLIHAIAKLNKGEGLKITLDEWPYKRYESSNFNSIFRKRKLSIWTRVKKLDNEIIITRTI